MPRSVPTHAHSRCKVPSHQRDRAIDRFIKSQAVAPPQIASIFAAIEREITAPDLAERGCCNSRNLLPLNVLVRVNPGLQNLRSRSPQRILPRLYNLAIGTADVLQRGSQAISAASRLSSPADRRGDRPVIRVKIMDGIAEAIGRFLDDVFEFKRCFGNDRLAEKLFHGELEPERHSGYSKEYIEQRVNEAWDAQTNTKQPMIDAHTKLLASGGVLAKYLAPYPEVSRRLHTFLYHMDWRVFQKDKGLEVWPDLAIDLNQLLASLDQPLSVKLASMPAEPPAADDPDGWVLMSKLQWPAGFEDHRKRSAFLDEHSEQIRNRKPRKNRREVWAADFVNFWARRESECFEGLDGREPLPIVPDGGTIPTDTYINNAAKMYGRVFEGKRQRQ